MMVAQTKGVPAAQRAAASEKMELMLSSLYALAFPRTPLYFSVSIIRYPQGNIKWVFPAGFCLLFTKILLDRRGREV
jgi:hypothetical protein